jgi:5'-nucleotidase
MKRALILLPLLLAGCATAPQKPAEPVHVVLVGTTDVHGWFGGHKEEAKDGTKVEYGGAATFAAYVNALRAASGDNVVLVDSGDMFQGTLESNLFEGEPVIRAYNTLGYAAAAVGNHEFDFGPVGSKTIPQTPDDDPLGALKKNASIAAFPLLSANMTEKSTGRTPAWAKRYTMVNVDGAQIGIIGLSTPDTPNVTMEANVRTLSFSDPVAATVDAARELRAAGADAIVVIAHIGGRCPDVSNPLDPSKCETGHEGMRYLNTLPPGTIDAYFAGHSHSQMRHFINGVAVVQAWPYSSDFSTVDLWVDTAASRVIADRTVLRPHTMICPAVFSGTERCDARSKPANASLVPRTFEGRTITPDAQLAQVVQPFLERTEKKRSEPVGVAATDRATRNYSRESALGNLLSDVLREAYSTDIGIMNSGGIRSDLRAGDLTYGDIFEVSPFDNYPAIVTLTGAQIMEMLRVSSTGERGLFQVSGLKYTFDAARDADKPFGQRNRLVSVTMDNGDPIDPARAYTVVMPDFVAYGGDGMANLMKDVPKERLRIDQSRPLRDVVIDVLRRRGTPVAPRVEGRITILNAPQRASE